VNDNETLDHLLSLLGTEIEIWGKMHPRARAHRLTKQRTLWPAEQARYSRARLLEARDDMHDLTTDSDRKSAADFARDAAEAWSAVLGPRLLGAYLMGSLAHGGYGARYSDIDVAIVAADPLTPEDLAALRGEAAAVSMEHAAKLSIFWTDRTFAIGRFPPLDRIDYLDNAIRLVEREAVRPLRPSPADVRAYLGGTPFERWAERAVAFSAAPGPLVPTDRKAYLRAHLYPARFIYSWVTGTIASNDAAVAFLDTNAPPGLDVAIIVAAHRCRLVGDDPDDLFTARGLLPGQVEACRRLMTASP
jgi:predicted nucleotidyltransferase